MFFEQSKRPGVGCSNRGLLASNHLPPLTGVATVLHPQLGSISPPTRPAAVVRSLFGLPSFPRVRDETEGLVVLAYLVLNKRHDTFSGDRGPTSLSATSLES